MAEVYDFDLEEYAETTLYATYLDENGAPVDLTSYTAKLAVKKLVTDSDPPLLVLSTTPSASGDITLGGPLGTIVARFDHSEISIASLGGQSFVYDLFLINGAGVPEKLLKGKIRVDRSVTDPIP